MARPRNPNPIASLTTEQILDAVQAQADHYVAGINQAYARLPDTIATLLEYARTGEHPASVEAFGRACRWPIALGVLIGECSVLGIAEEDPLRTVIAAAQCRASIEAGERVSKRALAALTGANLTTVIKAARVLHPGASGEMLTARQARDVVERLEAG